MTWTCVFSALRVLWAWMASSPLALSRSGRRNLAPWYPVGSLPLRFLLTGTRAVPFVPPIVLDLLTAGIRRRQLAVLLFARGTLRSAGLYPLSGSTAKAEMGRLRQAALRWPAASGRLRRPLHPPRCYFQPSARRYRRRAGEIPLAGLPRPQSAENHDPLGR